MDETGEFNDWELLQLPDVGLHSAVSNPDSQQSNSVGEGSLQSDYFTLKSEIPKSLMFLQATNSNQFNSVDPPRDDENILVGFDGIDQPNLDYAEFRLESSSGEEEEKTELAFKSNELSAQNPAEFDLDSGGHLSDQEMASGFSEGSENGVKCVESQLGLGDFAEKNDGVEVLSSVGIETGNSSSVEDVLGDVTLMEGESSAKIVANGDVAGGEGEHRAAVWWKLPLELLKLCVFRVSPVWTVSIAAAVVGFVMLARRLRRMKPKTRRIPLKISVDDKNVSQFMNHANRLNEAFSIVKRAPINRSSLPTARVVTPWPVIAIR